MLSFPHKAFPWLWLFSLHSVGKQPCIRLRRKGTTRSSLHWSRVKRTWNRQTRFIMSPCTLAWMVINGARIWLGDVFLGMSDRLMGSRRFSVQFTVDMRRPSRCSLNTKLIQKQQPRYSFYQLPVCLSNAQWWRWISGIHAITFSHFPSAWMHRLFPG